MTTWCRLQKLKSDAVGDGRRPRFYLSLNGLLLFPVVRGGIELHVGLRPKPRPPRSVGSSPPTLRSEHTDDELSNLSFCRQTARNGYVVEFSFFGSNVSPFFHTLSATAAILRAKVNRAISARIPFCLEPLNVAAVRLAPATGKRL